MFPASVSNFLAIHDKARLLHLVNSRPAMSGTASTGAIELRIVFVKRAREAAQHHGICTVPCFDLPSFLSMRIIADFLPRMITGAPFGACRKHRAIKATRRSYNRVRV